MSSKAIGKGMKKGIKGQEGAKATPGVAVSNSGNNDARKRTTSTRSMLWLLSTI
jgi:hypothetical protein